MEDNNIESIIHPDPKVHIPRLQKLVEAAWDLKTIRKERTADSVTFSFTISRDQLPDDRLSLFADAVASDS